MGRPGPQRIFGVSVLAALGNACGGQAVGQTSSVDGTPPTSADGGSVDGGGPTRLTVHSQGWGSVQVRDELKNVDCAPTLAADGTERCLPSGGQRVAFADSDCTHAVIPGAPDVCGTVPVYFTHAGGLGGCLVPGTTTYSLGAAIDTPPALYFQNLGLCTLVTDVNATALGLPAGPFYEAVISDPADWVELTKDVVPVTDALGVASWKGADGSLIPDGLRLLPSGTPCDPYPFLPAEAPVRCVPTLRAQAKGGYADDQCRGESVVASCAPTDVVDLGSGFDSSGAPIGGLFETGKSISPAYVQNPFADYVCAALPRSVSDPSYFYTVGPPLALDRYPLLTLTIEGTGRIQTEYLTSAGKNLFAESLYDSKYGERCAATELSDGGTWCVPESAVGFFGYADAGCTAPLGFGASTQPSWGLLYPPDRECHLLPPALYSTVPYDGPAYQITWQEGGPKRCEQQLVVPQQVFQPGQPLDPSQVFAPVLPVP